MQRALLTLQQFSTANGMKINVGKTKAMKFGSGGPKLSEDFFRIDQEIVETVKNFCYLGVEISNKGIATTRHTEERVRKARIAFSSIPKP